MDPVCKGSCSVRYLSTVYAHVAKAAQHCPIPGFYSGIFGMYLNHHGSQQSAYKAKNIIFYALWLLYALSAAITIIHILGIYWWDAVVSWRDAVSKDDHGCLTLCQ